MLFNFIFLEQIQINLFMYFLNSINWRVELLTWTNLWLGRWHKCFCGYTYWLFCLLGCVDLPAKKHIWMWHAFSFFAVQTWPKIEIYKSTLKGRKISPATFYFMQISSDMLQYTELPQQTRRNLPEEICMK